MRKNKFISLLFILQIASLFNAAKGQIGDKKSSELFDVINEGYLSIYSTVQQQGKVDLDKFIGLFLKDVKIENDYCELPGVTKVFDNAMDYINDFTETFSKDNAPNFSNLEVDVPNKAQEMIFCQEKDYYHVWLKKEFNYKYYNEPKTVASWVRLKLALVGTRYKIIEIKKEKRPVDYDGDNVADIAMGNSDCDICKSSIRGKPVTIKGCWNEDFDGDGVKNDDDLCKYDAGSRAAHGCPDKDNDGIQDSEDQCADRKGPHSNKGCPISELILSVAGGGVLPDFTPYSEQKILNNQTYTWLNNSGLASYGLLYNVALEYNFSTWLGIEAGAMNFTTKFDANRLRVNLDVYLSKNNVPANEVSVTSNAYQYNMAYFKLSFGNYRIKKFTVKGEPFIGYAFNGFSRNETLVRVNYKNGGSQSETLSFKTEPFIMYGADIKAELWFPGNWGMSFKLYGMAGTNKFEKQEAQFAGLPDKLQFSSQQMKLIGASLGFHFRLAGGFDYYKD